MPNATRFYIEWNGERIPVRVAPLTEDEFARFQPPHVLIEDGGPAPDGYIMVGPGLARELSVEELVQFQETYADGLRESHASTFGRGLTPTEECHMARREAQRAANRERARLEKEEARRKADTARLRARQALERMLNDEQRKALNFTGCFTVIGSHGTTYRIDGHDYSGNVWWLDEEGQRAGNFCCHPNLLGRDLKGNEGLIPIYDCMLAQKLALQADEIKFLELANLFSGQYPPIVRDHREKAWRCKCTKCILQRRQIAW